MRSSVKMFFNPDPSKQTTEVSFSRKQNHVNPLPLEFNDKAV